MVKIIPQIFRENALVIMFGIGTGLAYQTEIYLGHNSNSKFGEESEEACIIRGSGLRFERHQSSGRMSV